MKPSHFMLYSILIILVIVSILIYPIIYQRHFVSTQINNNPNQVSVIAHRGANKKAPENTLSAISKAIALGVDMVEIDIHLTKDNQLIVLHDETLERTTNGTGNVSDYTLAELKRLDAGSWFSKEFIGEELPTLNEALELIDGRTTCLIEIKWGNKKPYIGIEKKVVESILINNALEWVIVQSFEDSYLKGIHESNPKIKLGKLLLGSWQLPIPFHYDYRFHWGSYSPPPYLEWVNFYYKRSTKSVIKQLQKKGVKVAVFTPNSKSDLTKQINMGVDGIITNDPKTARSLLKK